MKKKLHGFSYTKNITNFKAFRWNNLLSAKLLLLKGVNFFFFNQKIVLYIGTLHAYYQSLALEGCLVFFVFQYYYILLRYVSAQFFSVNAFCKGICFDHLGLYFEQFKKYICITMQYVNKCRHTLYLQILAKDCLALSHFQFSLHGYICKSYIFLRL